MHFGNMNAKGDSKDHAAVTEAPAPKPRYKPKPKGSWRKIVGRAKDDDLSLEAFRLGAEWRERMNREGK